MSNPNLTATTRRQKRRLLADAIGGKAIGIGGVWVILTIVLIFFYLLAVVAPIFQSAKVSLSGTYDSPGQAATLLLGIEESGELGYRVTATDVVFFDLEDGTPGETVPLALPPEAQVQSAQPIGINQRHLGLRLSTGQLLIAKVDFRVSFVDDRRVLYPDISYPFGDAPIDLGSLAPQDPLAVTLGEDAVTLVTQSDSRRLNLYQHRVNPLFGTLAANPETESTWTAPIAVERVLLDPQGRWLYLADLNGVIALYDLGNPETPELTSINRLLPDGVRLSAVELLLGGVSVLGADNLGVLHQWSVQRDTENRYSLVEVRNFDLHEPALHLRSEQLRKGVVAASDSGRLLVLHTTAERTLLDKKVLPENSAHFVLGPRADHLLVEDSASRLHHLTLHNPHPEISWSSIWSQVQYEGYTEPDYIWQSSSADNDFEPKFSLVPLSFGTLKAAAYAMLFATPLAIFGAIYTAYFMSPSMRAWVKPSIEIMEALPTVILGFLAGLWLAPVVEDHLLAVFALLLFLPLTFVFSGWLWLRLPAELTRRVPDGWHAALLIPVVLLSAWAAFNIAPLLEQLWFGGSLRIWLEQEAGISYDQRNSLVVGMAMGLAVIPTIFSITEDAIFSVPKHLTFGSLALGATPWQTLTRVVLLTASPGIFSAVMIGLGRAVGETMIVLMATGNTPVMDFNIFQGMRTLSANIAVELPESEVHSTHYRILFLAALVLFIVTFAFNTIAELVRQNLRRKYGNL
ncbi:MAG: ABC transporter permease subunit [Pseudomonadota bacterium]|nr:ABC transporter permease subunit [Pseudomonadota bacterium]